MRSSLIITPACLLDQAAEEKWSHITADDRKRLLDECTAADQWLASALSQQVSGLAAAVRAASAPGLARGVFSDQLPAMLAAAHARWRVPCVRVCCLLPCMLVRRLV